jgi:hypothetical protein
MRTPRRHRCLSSLALGSALLLHLFVTGCSRGENADAPGGSPPQVVGSADPAPASAGLAITRAGVNAPSGDSFTCWIKGTGFREGDRVLVSGSTQIPTTFGSPELVTFVAPVSLLERRTGLTLVVFRPGTELRSNPFDAPIPAASPEG